MHNKFKKLSTEDGFSLIEVLASIVLLGIIIGSFITFFLQSTRTNSLSDNMTDASYVAQQEIENLYNLSKTYNLSDGKNYLINTNNYKILTPCTTDNCYEKSTNGYYITIEIKNPDSNQISGTLVKVFTDSSKTNLKAQLETKLVWKNL